MAGYADVRRLLAEGWSMAQINQYLKTQGAPGKSNMGPPESTIRKGGGTQFSKTRGLGGAKQIYERLPGARDAELVNLSQRNMAWGDPGGPGEFTEMEAMAQPPVMPEPVAVKPAPFSPPPVVSSADQKLAQAAQQLPGPKVNWQNGPSQAFYEESAGWNMKDRGMSMGSRPMASQLPAATRSVMGQGMPQLDQQRKMVSEGLLAQGADNKDAQRVNIMQQANFDMLGQQNSQSMFNPMSFLGKIFGGMF